MATRTIKLMGKAYSTDGNVSLVVNFNNNEVFNGTVETQNSGVPSDPDSGVELASWTIDTSVSGAIPLSITVSGGTLHFGELHGNYSGFEMNDDGSVKTHPVDYFDVININTAETDGKNNVAFSDDKFGPQDRDPIDGEHGDWIYTILDGVTFSCDYSVDTDLIFEEE